MLHFKKILSLLSVFALIVLAGLLGVSELKAQTNADTDTNSTECVQEGGIARTTVSPEYQTECCEGLEAIEPYNYGENSNGRMMGAGSLCYDPSKGVPQCLEKDEMEVEGWYYSEGTLLTQFACELEDDEEDADENDENSNENNEEDEGMEEGRNREREKILNLRQMRYYKDIIRKEDGSLYGVKKDQEIIDRINQNNKTEEVAERKREENKEQAEKMIQERKEEIEKIRNNVDSLTKNISQNLREKIEELQNKLQQQDRIIEEQQNRINHVVEILKDQNNLSDDIKVAISEFISKGTEDNSKKIGEGERAAVLKSYKHAFGHLPTNKEEIEDAIKISNGRFPSKISETAENKAKLEFEKIYNRQANLENPNDKAAVSIMAYGLRQKAQNRNLQSELKGIHIFEDIYGHKPQNTQEWNAMQAITYSGAKK